MTDCSGGGGKPICPICYEDFKPLAEELQSISACGHVFHELCIQQWVEYCRAGKRPTCPVCKQSFASQKDLVRLFFQSAENGGAATQRPSSPAAWWSSAEAEEARKQCGRLEGKLASLTALLETQTKRVQELNAEVSRLTDRVSKDERLRDAYRREKEDISRLLQAKEKELSATAAECARHKERALALAKELAALKLATDANLEEPEVERLVMIGNESRQADKIDVLKRSLVIRNKKYKELIAQCNRIGRAESRALQKLEKAEERIFKLKERLLELEKANEEKENGILRNLKVSKRITVIESNSRLLQTVSDVGVFSPEGHNEKSIKIDENLKGFFSLKSQVLSKKNEQVLTGDVDLSSNADVASNPVPDSSFPSWSDSGLCNSIPSHSAIQVNQHPVHYYNEGATVHYNNMCEFSEKMDTFNTAAGNRTTETYAEVMNLDNGTEVENLSGKKSTPALPSEPLLIEDDDFEDGPLPIKNKLTREPVALTEVPCFSRGLLHADGGNGHKGKWIPHGKPLTFPMQTSNDGCLIGVGPDGKGGRVKILRTLEHPMRNTVQTLRKRHKPEAKTAPVSRRNLHIEHFFGKQVQS